jgi:hypothetical protein
VTTAAGAGSRGDAPAGDGRYSGGMTARVELLTPERYRAMPWKNGGGVTHEILIGPDGAGVESFGWRLSIAEVACDGPFSSFADCDRSILLLDGAGMTLVFDGRPVRLVPRVPFAFSGDAACAGRLETGPVRDLNVITRRGAAQHALGVQRAGADAERLLAAPLVAFVALDDSAVVTVDGVPHTLPAGATLVARDARRARATSAGDVAIASFAPR